MKVFTFNAPSNSSVEFLWPLRSTGRNAAFHPFINNSNWTEVKSIKECDLAIFPRKVFDPRSLMFDKTVFRAADEVAAYGKPLIIDATCDSDVPLEIPTANILRFGLYKSLMQPYEIERPYWTGKRRQGELEALPIRPRTQKPIVGFCGTTSSAGKFFKIGRSLPFEISRTVLSHGLLARRFDSRLKKGMSHRLRDAAMNLLASDKRVNCKFEVTNHLNDYYNDANLNKKKLEELFTETMDHCDYALCVRGVGNYSSRFYMALNSGRIPLVVDTDHVFPLEEHIHMVRVPPHRLDKISDFVLNHFESLSEKELSEMKQENRAFYNRMLSPEHYIPRYIESVLHQAHYRMALKEVAQPQFQPSIQAVT
jgi:hypothetical protein